MSESPDGIRPDPDYRVLARSPGFCGRVVGVSVDRVVLPGGCELEHESIRLPAAVGIVPLLAGADGPEVVLVEQFRCAVGGWMHEIPAGIVEPGEEPRATAIRELAEETGYRAGSVAPLVSVLAIPGTSDHRMHYFLAEDLESGESRLEAEECLTVKRFPLRLLVESLFAPPGAPPVGLADRVVVDAKTHLALLHVSSLLERRDAARRPREESS